MLILKLKCEIYEVTEEVENAEMYEDMGIHVENNIEYKDGFIYINPEAIESFFPYGKQVKVLLTNDSFVLNYTFEEFAKILADLDFIQIVDPNKK